MYFARSRDFLGQEKYQQYVLAHGKVVGEVVHGRIGVDGDGFREDWAVANAEQEKRGQNGVRWGVGELELLAEFVG